MEDWMHNANRVEMITIGMEQTIEILRKKLTTLDVEYQKLLNQKKSNSKRFEDAAYAMGVADTLRKLDEAAEAESTTQFVVNSLIADELDAMSEESICFDHLKHFVNRLKRRAIELREMK